MRTVLDCIETGTRYLQDRGVSDARSNMQWLVANQLGCSRIELYTQFDRPLSEDELVPLRAGLKRRGNREPLQHILGTVEFCGLEFLCDERALIPRPETEELAEAALDLQHSVPARVLDMGSGSGVLGLTVANTLADRCSGVTLADISPDALELARENAERLGIDADFVETDLFAAIAGSYDLIVANLPYVAGPERDSLAPELAHDPSVALFGGHDGLDVIRRFIPQAAGALSSGGFLAMEIGQRQAAEVLSMMTEAGLAECHSTTDLTGHQRFAFARKTS